MAIINKRSGFYGFTYNPNSSGIEDENGSVNKCIVSILYPLQSADVDFTISKGIDDWAIQMGDGSIIPLSNPTILFQNRDSSIVEFDMSRSYPSNSPGFLVYKSDTATFEYKLRSSNRPFEVNTITGNFAFTVQGYGGSVDTNGQVNRILATITFPMQPADVDVMISTDPSHWGARMPDGNIIPLRDPIILATNRDNVVIQFSMDKSYPANSPCLIVYRSASAVVQVNERLTESVFIPVTDITDVPTSVTTGMPIDLSGVVIKPFNATYQGVIWTVESGNATVKDSTFTANEGGEIRLKATIAKGGVNKTDYSKTFVINASASITILTQPQSITVARGQIIDTLSVSARISGGTLKYQWYRNTVNNTVGGTAITNATNARYNLPSNLTAGQWYYYCMISDEAGTTLVVSDVAVVLVIVPVTNITISPEEANVAIGNTLQLIATIIPSDATNKNVKWASSRNDIATVNQIGLVSSTGNGGDVVITATSDDGGYIAASTLHMQRYVGVTDITGIPESSKVGQDILLNPIISPSDATYQDIKWTITSELNTGATIEGNIIHVPNVGDRAIIIRATIDDGKAIGVQYIKEFRINIMPAHIPVEDILGTPEKATVGEELYLTSVISPYNATYQTIEWSIITAASTGATITGNVLRAINPGVVTVQAKIKNGLAEGRDYTKIFYMIIRDRFVEVSDIVDLPDEIIVNTDHPLTATVVPENATHKDIEWSIVDAKNTGAVMTGDNTIKATRTGNLTLKATIYGAYADGEFVDNQFVYDDPNSDGAKRDPMTRQFTATVVQGFIAVTDITDVAERYTIGDTLTLSATVVPSNATNTTITWSVQNANGTGARISSGRFTATSAGTAKIRATIANGKSQSGFNSSFTKDFDIIVEEPFIPVTDITNVPTTYRIGESLTLTGDIIPENATNQEITWGVTNGNGTGARISRGVFTATATGTADIRATIINGTSEDENYTQDFSIEVQRALVPVIDIQDVPEETYWDEELVLTGDVIPSNATYQDIEWTITDLNGTNARIDDGNKFICPTDDSNDGSETKVITVEAKIDYQNGSQYTKDIDITVSPRPQVDDPTISSDPEDSETFTDQLEISISCTTDDATIYYTTDGEDPTASEENRYSESFTIFETTTVKAFAVKDDMRDSNIVTVTYTKTESEEPEEPEEPTEQVETPVITPDDSEPFSDEIEVTIECGTDEAVIYYITEAPADDEEEEESPEGLNEDPDKDDSFEDDDPLNNGYQVYEQSFPINESTIVKAFARKDSMKDSEIAVAIYIKETDEEDVEPEPEPEPEPDGDGEDESDLGS